MLRGHGEDAMRDITVVARSSRRNVEWDRQDMSAEAGVRCS